VNTYELKLRAFRAVRAAADRIGLQVVPKTFYSPIPDLKAVPPDIWDRRSELRGIHFDLDEQLAWIEANVATAMQEFAPQSTRPVAPTSTRSTTIPTGGWGRTSCTAWSAASNRGGSSSSGPVSQL
jgi:hypothetical protein